MAEENSAEHVLCVLRKDEWRCAKPGTGIYSFVVLLRPGVVAMWGDLGEYVLRHSGEDSLVWLRRAVTDPGYLLGIKVLEETPR